MTSRIRESIILGEASMGRVPRDKKYGGPCGGCVENLVSGEVGRCMWLMPLEEPEPATPDEVAQWLAERGEW